MCKYLSTFYYPAPGDTIIKDRSLGMYSDLSIKERHGSFHAYIYGILRLNEHELTCQYFRVAEGCWRILLNTSW